MGDPFRPGFNADGGGGEWRPEFHAGGGWRPEFNASGGWHP